MPRHKQTILLTLFFILPNIYGTESNVITAEMNGTLYFTVQRTNQKVNVKKTKASNSTLQELVDTFIAHLEKQQQVSITTKPKLAIFDVYDTLLTQQGSEPIKPVVTLYNYFLMHNYHIALVSGRKSTPEQKQQTLRQLATHNLMYNEHTLFLRPITWSQSVSAWKESIRKQLAESYDIIATIDDDWHNLTGSCVGQTALWLPSSKIHPGSENFYAKFLNRSKHQRKTPLIFES